MDDLLRLARSHQARLSDPAFEEQCNDLEKLLQSIAGDFKLLHELQRVFSDFRKAALNLKTLCSKIDKHWPVGAAVSLVGAASETSPEQHAVYISQIIEPHRFANGVEHKCHNDRVLDTLLRFRVAAQELNNEWQETDGTHAIDTTGAYPFQEDFEDVLTKIIIWTEATFRRVDGYCVLCCFADHAECSLTAGCPCCDARNSQGDTQKDAFSRRRVATKRKRRQGTQRRKTDRS